MSISEAPSFTLASISAIFCGNGLRPAGKPVETAATGMPDGMYRLGKFEMELRDGVCWHDGHLAGSALTMDRAVRNVMQFAGWNLRQAVRLATANPAKVARAAGRGQLIRGAAADFVVLSPQGDVVRTIIGGRVATN